MEVKENPKSREGLEGRERLENQERVESQRDATKNNDVIFYNLNKKFILKITSNNYIYATICKCLHANIQ